jgi:hypothetical protein
MKTGNMKTGNILLPLAAAMGALALATTSANAALLMVDFGGGPTQSGFVGQTTASATHSTLAGDVTVTVSSTSVSDSAFGSDLLRDVLYSVTVPLTVTLSGPGIAPSTSYDLTFWTFYGGQDKQMVVAPVSGTGGASIGPSVVTATEFDNTSNNLTGTFTSSGTGVLTFNLTSQTSNIHLTNGFSIDAVPEPSSITLLSLGGLGLILRRRRK